MVARLHPMKDPENLVEAIRRARQSGHDLHMLIMGRDIDRPDTGLAKAITAALPCNRVTTTGPRTAVAHWLPGPDLFELPSAWGAGFPTEIGTAAGRDRGVEYG